MDETYTIRKYWMASYNIAKVFTEGGYPFPFIHKRDGPAVILCLPEPLKGWYELDGYEDSYYLNGREYIKEEWEMLPEVLEYRILKLIDET